MKITVVGCGNAFSLATKNGNSSFLLEENNSKMLIDCGRTAPEMLNRLGYSFKDITHLYVSHMHGDHIGAIEHFGFERYDWVNKPSLAYDTSPTIIANTALMSELWSNALRGTMESIEGLDANLNTFFNVLSISPNATFVWEGWTCRLVQQVHVVTGSIIKHTYGLIMKNEGHQTVYFVTDSQHCSPNQAQVFYKEADIIFQDCELIGVDTINKEMKFCSHVHANYGQLAGYKGSNSTILSKSLTQKMWLTHYQDFKNEDLDFFKGKCDWTSLSKEDGFAGFVEVGQMFEV